METLTAAQGGDDANIGAAILMRFTDPNNELDLEIRKLIVVLSGPFRGQNAPPPTPVTYLGATCSSLDVASGQMLDAHLTILSIVIPKVPAAFLITNLRPVFDSVARPLRSSSPIDQSTGCLVVKCIAQLFITVANVVSWSDVSELYSFFLDLANFDGFRVREQLHACLADVLQSFQGTPLLYLATKQITDLLNKYPLLVNYDENTSESVPSQEEKALFTLEVVNVSLSLLSTEDRTAVLVYYKSLLELNKFDVTSRISDGLYRLCLDPSADHSPQLLLDIVLSLCLFVTQHKIIPRTIASFLSAGVTKVYSYDRKMCEVNLPIVFDALKVILTSRGARKNHDIVPAFKCLINTCVDESLIKEGVHYVVINASVGDGIKSEPTVIENLCATIQSLLGYHRFHKDQTESQQSNRFCETQERFHNYKIWCRAFEIFSTMIDKLGPYSSYLMRGTLKTLADMHLLPHKEFPFKEKVELLLKKLVQICGFDAVIAVMPQEHKKLLVEINEMVSRPVEVIPQVLEATTVRVCKFDEDKARCKAKREMTKRMSDAAGMAKKMRLQV
ncbi:uncharacterized protein LOC126790091 [Argentina anserina]|uniref:uncharacterized protein LOC126790091 n=1 Tax=Argentina anserina TaxID=57926 RepID=UPI002176478E|nr:uncharacterized protein LOC126790091 [Potentilla anserina]